MAIVEQQIMDFFSGQVRVFRTLDNKNTTNATRWRTQTMRCINGSTRRVYVYCEEPSTGDRFRVELDPGTSFDLSVPTKYQAYAPDDLSWGCGEV